MVVTEKLPRPLYWYVGKKDKSQRMGMVITHVQSEQSVGNFKRCKS